MSSKFNIEHKKLFETKYVAGKTFNLVKINSNSEEDASFVIALRNRKLNNYLRTSSISLSQQMNYFKNYQLEYDEGEQIYYKIFDVSKNSFTFGPTYCNFELLKTITTFYYYYWPKIIL